MMPFNTQGLIDLLRVVAVLKQIGLDTIQIIMQGPNLKEENEFRQWVRAVVKAGKTIALGYLVFNRLAKLDEGTKAIIEQAEKQLDLLNKGVNIFNLPDKIEATKIDVEGPTLAERVALNTLPLRTRNFYPSEGQRLPLFRGGGSDG